MDGQIDTSIWELWSAGGIGRAGRSSDTIDYIRSRPLVLASSCFRRRVVVARHPYLISNGLWIKKFIGQFSSAVPAKKENSVLWEWSVCRIRHLKESCTSFSGLCSSASKSAIICGECGTNTCFQWFLGVFRVRELSLLAKEESGPIIFYRKGGPVPPLITAKNWGTRTTLHFYTFFNNIYHT